MKLQYKLFTFFIILLILFGAATIVFTSTILKKELENRLIAREKIGLEVLESRIFPFIANRDYVTVTSILFEEKEIKKESIYYIIVYDKNENIISHTFLNEIPEHLKLHAHEDTEDFLTTEFRINDVPVIEMTTLIREGAYEVGHLSIGYKKDYIENIVSQIIRAIVNIIIILMSFSIILSLVLSTFIVKPVEELSRGMEEVRKGNLSHKIEVVSKDEIGELANAFNKMAEDLKKSHNELQENEKKYRMLFESAGDGIFILDAEGEKTGMIVAANQAAADMHGYTVNELLTLKITDLDTPDAAREAPDRIRRMLSGERIKTEITHRRKDGTVFPIEISAGLLELGSRKFILAIDRDITMRKRAEEALKLFSEAVENAMDGVQITDIEGHIIYSNKSVEEIYGFSPEELKGKHVDEMNSDPEFASKVILPTIKETGHWSGELMVKHKNGKIFPILLTTSIVKNGKGEPIAMIGIIHDITQRKQAEEAIKKYARELEESNRMKELFSDIMHHDLMNPLNVSKGYIELLHDVETDSQKKAYIETIERNLIKGIDLMESTTLLSRLESMESIEFKEMDLREVMGEVIESMSPMVTGAQMTIENKINLSMPARANKIIEEVFVNLISNAVKYAPGGKRIIVDGEEKGDCWRIRVVDFGEGIKEPYKAMIFERFHRKEKKGVKGSGLGLAIARKIMELHKGRIWMEDNPEGGAIFVVEIPKL